LASWVVAKTRPLCELKAGRNLRQQGFEVYLPQMRTPNQRVALMFPSYLFVQVIDRWYSILGTIGVSYVLRDGDVPARLPETFVDSLKARERDGAVVLDEAPSEVVPALKVGQRVRIVGGPLQGKLGLYDGMTAHQREVVLLGSLGRVEMASGNLVAA